MNRLQVEKNRNLDTTVKTDIEKQTLKKYSSYLSRLKHRSELNGFWSLISNLLQI